MARGRIAPHDAWSARKAGVRRQPDCRCGGAHGAARVQNDVLGRALLAAGQSEPARPGASAGAARRGQLSLGSIVECYVPTGPHVGDHQSCYAGNPENVRTCDLWRVVLATEPMMVVSVDRFLSGGDWTGVVQPAVSWDRELIAYQLRDYKPNSNNDTVVRKRIHVRTTSGGGPWSAVDSAGTETGLFTNEKLTDKDEWPDWPAWQGPPGALPFPFSGVPVLWWNDGSGTLYSQVGPWVTKTTKAALLSAYSQSGGAAPDGTPVYAATFAPGINPAKFKNVSFARVTPPNGGKNSMVGFGFTNDGVKNRPMALRPQYANQAGADAFDLVVPGLSKLVSGCHHPTWSPSARAVACHAHEVDAGMLKAGRDANIFVQTVVKFAWDAASGQWAKGTLAFPTPTYEELDAQVPGVLSADTESVTFHYPQYAWDDEHLIVTLIVKERGSSVPRHSRCLVVYAPADGSAATFLDLTAAIEKEAHELDPDDEHEYFSVFGTCDRVASP